MSARISIFPAITAMVLPVVIASCSGNETGSPDQNMMHKVYANARELTAADTVSEHQNDIPMPDGPVVRMKVNHFGSYAKAFDDSNYVHWAAADSIGLGTLTDTRSHWKLKRPIVKLVPCREYYVEPLTYSVPYVVPEAAAMVKEIGTRFNDTLRARGGGKYRIRITSVLHTPDAVRRLRRRNVNAVDSSVHQLGTTVDISYARFVPSIDNDVVRSLDDLKGVLAEILRDMRAEGKCYIKYERKQPCFHITVRPGAYDKN